MARPVIDFKIIEEQSSETFSAKVLEALKDGYDLHGSTTIMPQMKSFGTREFAVTTFFQPVVKYKNLLD